MCIKITSFQRSWVLKGFSYKLIMKSSGFQTVSFSCWGNTLKHTQIIHSKSVLSDGGSMGLGTVRLKINSRINILFLGLIAYIYLPSLNISSAIHKEWQMPISKDYWGSDEIMCVKCLLPALPQMPFCCFVYL